MPDRKEGIFRVFVKINKLSKRINPQDNRVLYSGLEFLKDESTKEGLMATIEFEGFMDGFSGYARSYQSPPLPEPNEENLRRYNLQHILGLSLRMARV